MGRAMGCNRVIGRLGFAAGMIRGPISGTWIVIEGAAALGAVGIVAAVSFRAGVRPKISEYDWSEERFGGVSVADDDGRERGALRFERRGEAADGGRGIFSGAADAKRSAAGLSRLVETVNAIRGWRVRLGCCRLVGGRRLCRLRRGSSIR
jgi:hypothetical protein